ncbi:hypothetical protein Tco_0546383 [Tanacetum coccineum]
MEARTKLWHSIGFTWKDSAKRLGTFEWFKEKTKWLMHKNLGQHFGMREQLAFFCSILHSVWIMLLRTSIPKTMPAFQDSDVDAL